MGDTTPLGERSHALHVFTGRAHERLGELESVLTASMTTAERGETVAEATRLRDRLDALITRLVAEDPAVVTELRDRTNVSAQTVRRISKRARQLTAHPEVAAALATGQIHTDQAEVITHVVDRLPTEVAHLAGEATGVMLELALSHDAPTLKTMGNHLIHVVAPDLADQLLAAQLEREEQHARRTAYLKTHRDGHGSVYGKFKIPQAAAHLLESYLQAIANPQRPQPIDRTNRDLPEVKGLAFVELIERIKAKDLPKTGGSPVAVVVTMTLDTLEGGLRPAGLLGTDLLLSAGQARRLAARHGVIPIVLDSQSQILDLGRKRRYFNKAQRLALAIRQGGVCNRDGCDIPAAWCDANHRDDWARGGHTNLDKAELVCTHHHQDHHRGINFPRRT